MTQQFEAKKLPIDDVMLIVPFLSSDERGDLVKDYSRDLFSRFGLAFEPHETAYIHSRKNVIRGLHVQTRGPQPRLIRCLSGAIWAVVTDLRCDSQTLGKCVGMELNECDRQGLFVPDGCAFGSLALEDCLISCQYGGPFIAEYAGGVRWDDPTLRIEWPLAEAPILSAKDRQLQSYQMYLEKMERELR